MKAGDIVKFSAPTGDFETRARFRVLEVRGERLLVELVDSRFSIAPTSVYLAEDLVKA